MARSYFPHIYFEAARPRGRDSVTGAVGELDERPGVTGFEEYKCLALAQLVDYADKLTVDHHGNIIRFTRKLWNGRRLVLIRLGARKWPKKYKRVLEVVDRYRELMDKYKDYETRIMLTGDAAGDLGVPEEEWRRMTRRLKQKRVKTVKPRKPRGSVKKKRKKKSKHK